MKKTHIIISGIVTGVGFRWWLKIKADERNIYGWVKNTAENNVEATFFGNEKEINDLIKICKKGPSSSKVENIKIEDYHHNYLRKTFDIIR